MNLLEGHVGIWNEGLVHWYIRITDAVIAAPIIVFANIMNWTIFLRMRRREITAEYHCNVRRGQRRLLWVLTSASVSTTAVTRYE
mmetsp:Transcript_31827/g.64800  ORF Transcript_31827/g.64800 Transcript_31827/m.64800 type:complete len:85 (-) Transcript_31827:226-480(-)